MPPKRIRPDPGRVLLQIKELAQKLGKTTDENQLDELRDELFEVTHDLLRYGSAEQIREAIAAYRAVVPASQQVEFLPFQRAVLPYADLLEVLLEAGLDPNYTTELDELERGETATLLAAAVNQGDDRAVRVLLRHDANPIGNVAEAFRLAAESVDTRNVTEMLRSGASPRLLLPMHIQKLYGKDAWPLLSLPLSLRTKLLVALPEVRTETAVAQVAMEAALGPTLARYIFRSM